jgi:carbohydrate-selective porin OprB
MSPGPRRDEEATFELTYQTRVDERWQFQPDLKYIVHPAGMRQTRRIRSDCRRSRMRSLSACG